MSNNNATNNNLILVDEDFTNEDGETVNLANGDGIAYPITNTNSSVNWFFTWNNPAKVAKEITNATLIKEYFEGKLGVNIKMMVYQLEKGENGTPHLQGIFKVREKVKLITLKNKARSKSLGMYIAPCVDWPNALKYVTKETTRVEGPYFFGCTLESASKAGKGARTDLAKVVTDIEDGKTIKEVAKANATTFIKHSTGIMKYFAMLGNTQRSWMTELHIYWGPTGTGKSHRAYETAKSAGGGVFYPNLPTTTNTTTPMWWDGYGGEENIIFDEFYGQVKMSEMLKLIDKYPHKVQIKGGMQEFVGKRVWITSNKPWNEWWDQNTYGLHHDAFKRRITSCQNLTEKWKDPIMQLQSDEEYQSNADNATNPISYLGYDPNPPTEVTNDEQAQYAANQQQFFDQNAWDLTYIDN